MAQYGASFGPAQKDPLLDAFYVELGSIDARVMQRNKARNELCFALTSQQIGLVDLTPEALMFYARAHMDACGDRAYAERPGVHLAWQALVRMGHFGPGTPSTLALARARRPRSVEQLVDQYHLSNQGVRTLLIDYLRHRSSEGMDHNTLQALSRTLASTFWKTVERVSPGQQDLHLSPATYALWLEDVSVVRTPAGTHPRTDLHNILMTVRALYLDLQSWSAIEPERWAQWVAPCPLPASATSGYSQERRRQSERIANRTRERQPMLPAMTAHVERERQATLEFLTRASAAAIDETFEHVGARFTRVATDREHKDFDRSGAARVRVRSHRTGDILNLQMAEDRAFWDWALLGVLRLAGVRQEELLELTQLSVRQYTRPGGEVVALLVIAPSKGDRERVIPMSAELFHIVAAIIGRHTSSGRTIPALQRWDPYESTVGPALPYLFQNSQGPVARCNSVGWLNDALARICLDVAAEHPQFEGLRFTPHDLRRLFATELVNNGLPIHIGAALLGHTNLQTTRGYVAVFNEDVVRHYQQYLERRRAQRNSEEYRPVTPEEWGEFEEHFDKRKVELGTCGRPYGTPCAHEHACIRCPMLHVSPDMLDRLNELETDLHARRDIAQTKGWIGEVEGIALTLSFLARKRTDLERLSATKTTALGLPGVGAPA
ncbi:MULTISPECIES: site-specific integrase [Williamsia]|jgi:integrase|uniref:Phage integrase family protein n=1 Tax=Williamsia limnetica TaxID=882452 RepID=A0A318RBM0_WILLI|nr:MULTISPECIES: site-specific integrase [Williamsia]ORM37234.1 hypothetical protein BFL43_04980 [Williamsia sp. 1135]PYE12497.1 phage integrase family protein [Williamsia limnetica]